MVGIWYKNTVRYLHSGSLMSWQHWYQYQGVYRVIFPDIGPDIGNIGADIETISGQYRDIPVPCQTRFYQYRAWYRVFPDIVPDIGSISGHTRSLPNLISGFSPISGPIWSRYFKNIGIYGYRDKKNPISFPMWMQYRNIPISGNSDIGRFSWFLGRYSITCCASAPSDLPHRP